MLILSKNTKKNILRYFPREVDICQKMDLEAKNWETDLLRLATNLAINSNKFTILTPFP